MNSLIDITQTVLFTPARLLGQVEYSSSASSQGQVPGPLFWICYLAFTILMIAAWWKIFTKAGQPGWACIIPIYNLYVWCKIVGRPWWWILLMLIPFVNFIIAIILIIDLAKSFGKGVGFGIGLLLLPFIFFPILGFGSAQYQGPTAGDSAAVRASGRSGARLDPSADAGVARPDAVRGPGAPLPIPGPRPRRQDGGEP